MESSFSRQPTGRSDFYLAPAGVSGVLQGLLIVAVSMWPSLVHRPEVADVRALGVMTYGNFFALLAAGAFGA